MEKFEAGGRWVAGIFVALLAAGCSVGVGGGEKRDGDVSLGDIYNEAARYHGPGRNPVILIPGILGSQLREGGSGALVWGDHILKGADPRTGEGLRSLGLPMEHGRALGDLRDEVEAFGVLSRVKLSVFFASVEWKAYIGVLKTLGLGGYYDEEIAKAGGEVDYGKGHFTCFQFPYDWRRSCAENAAELEKFIAVKKSYVASEYRKRFGVEGAEVKFDLVAHSQGGLVARYFLRYGGQALSAGGAPVLNWAGARDVEKVVLVATPSAGSIKALQQLLYGAKLGPGKRLKYPAGVLGTMPGLYELLPRERHGVLKHGDTGEVMDPLDVSIWEELGWGLFDPGQEDVLAKLLPGISDSGERRDVARDQVEKCLSNARKVHAALDRRATIPPGVTLKLYAGDASETNAFAKWYPEDKMVYVTGKAPGDGVVPRYSALMDERTGKVEKAPRLVSPVDWDEVTFLFSDHIGLTSDPVFIDNVLHTLMEER